jgi:hypothetical protein
MKTIELSEHELNMAIEGLELVYLRMLKKAAHMNQPRNMKTIEELRECQITLQKFLAKKAHINEEEIDVVAG